MLLENRGYVGTRDDLVDNYPTRIALNVEMPDQLDVREIWTEDGKMRLINVLAPESGKVHYNHKGACVTLTRYQAEMVDILANQPLPSAEEEKVLCAIRGTQWGYHQSIYIFNYGVMVGKHLERKRRDSAMDKKSGFGQHTENR